MSLPPGPPGPAFLQTIGYTYWTFPFFEECARRYGDPFTLRMPGFGSFVMLAAPEHIKQVFTGDPDKLHAGKANAVLEPVVGRHSVLLLDGKEHLRQRRLLLPPLHGERMKEYARLMGQIAAAELERMPVGAPFSIHHHMQTITLQVILRAVFGLDEGAQMDELAALLVEFTRPPPSLMIFVPPQYLKYGDFPLSPYRAFLRRREKVDRALRAILRAKQAKPDPSRTDILSMLLSARDEEGRAMTEDELRDELVTMLVAGHETTATELSWAFERLLRNRDALAKLTADVDSGEDAYVTATIRETLRRRPVLSIAGPRRVVAEIEVDGRTYGPGCHLVPNAYLVHHDPEIYPEPYAFRPERFLEEDPGTYTWIPFGGGRRRCLGASFAMLEMGIVLRAVLSRMEVRIGGAGRLEANRRRMITVVPGKGAEAILSERERAPVPA